MDISDTPLSFPTVANARLVRYMALGQASEIFGMAMAVFAPV